MTRPALLGTAAGAVGALLLAAQCAARAGAARDGGGDARSASPSPAVAAARVDAQDNLLRNGNFDAGGGGIPGWEQRGTEYATPTLVTSPVNSAPRALRMTVGGRGSTGDRSLMLYQVLDATQYRGQRLRFGARVRTQGAGVNITLFTPERAANVLHSDPATSNWEAREQTLDVPANASFLSLGIQVLGPSGSVVWVDDAFVRPDGGGRGGAARGGVAAGAAPGGSAGEVRRAGGARDLSPDGTADVTIDAGSVSHTVSPLLFGMHLEWVENGQGVVDNSGNLRPEVLSAFREIRVPLFRFPGGIHADYYDWRQGVTATPASSRGFNPFTKRQEPMRFGTPAFARLLEATDAQPMITANYGTGTAEQAADWARDFVARGVTPRYWEVGNEIYLTSPREDAPNGKAIYKAPDQYARDFPRFRDSIRAVVPDASVGAIVHVETGAYPFAPADNRDWTERMLAALRTPADFVAVHNSYAPAILDDRWDMANEGARADVYRAMFGSTAQVEDNFDRVAEAVARSPGQRGPVRIAVTEFGAFFGISRKMAYHTAYVDQTRTMATAVYIASLLDVFVGDARVFAAAFTNPVHKYYGSLLTDTDQELVRTPTFWLYEMYRTRFETRVVASTVNSPTFNSKTVGYVRGQEAQPDLLARAAVSASGRRLTAMLVNRDLANPLATTVTLRGFAPTAVDCEVLAASSPWAINGPSLTRTTVTGTDVRPRGLACARAGSAVTLTIPPSAVVSLVVTR